MTNPNLKTAPASAVNTVVTSAGTEILLANVWTLPTDSTFTVTHSITSTKGRRIILESADQTVGTINLFHNVNPTLLEELLPEDAYDGADIIANFDKLYFKSSPSAGSDTPYLFHYMNPKTAESLLNKTKCNSQQMAFPAKKEQFTGDEAGIAMAINTGNKGKAAVLSSKSGNSGIAGAISNFFGN